jgi:hypothetical protein
VVTSELVALAFPLLAHPDPHATNNISNASGRICRVQSFRAIVQFLVQLSTRFDNRIPAAPSGSDGLSK